MMYFVFFTIVSLLLVERVESWGPHGHKIIADLAEKMLTVPARNLFDQVASSNNVSLSGMATWADTLCHTSEFAWTGHLHYADTPYRSCDFTVSRDCTNGRCVVTAIGNYTKRLGDVRLPIGQRLEALKFLVHFVGDVHQPLHVGFKTDKGGNGVHLKTAFGSDSNLKKRRKDEFDRNLHSVWDSEMIIQNLVEKCEKRSWTQMSDRLWSAKLSKQHTPQLSEWSSVCANAIDHGISDETSCAATVARESSALACSVAYKHMSNTWIENGDTLNRAYFLSRLEVVENRLVQGAVRLASILDSVARFLKMPTSLIKKIERSRDEEDEPIEEDFDDGCCRCRDTEIDGLSSDCHDGDVLV